MVLFDIGKKTFGEDKKVYVTLKDKKTKTYIATLSLPTEYMKESLNWKEVELR